MTTVEVLVLRKARALIDTPEKWWPGEREPSNGRECAYLAVDTVLNHVDTYEHSALLALAHAMGVGSTMDVMNFNDSHTHAEVLAAFDRAIASA